MLTLQIQFANNMLKAERERERDQERERERDHITAENRMCKKNNMVHMSFKCLIL